MDVCLITLMLSTARQHAIFIVIPREHSKRTTNQLPPNRDRRWLTTRQGHQPGSQLSRHARKKRKTYLSVKVFNRQVKRKRIGMKIKTPPFLRRNRTKPTDAVQNRTAFLMARIGGCVQKVRRWKRRQCCDGLSRKAQHSLLSHTNAVLNARRMLILISLLITIITIIIIICPNSSLRWLTTVSAKSELDSQQMKVRRPHHHSFYSQQYD